MNSISKIIKKELSKDKFYKYIKNVLRYVIKDIEEIYQFWYRVMPGANTFYVSVKSMPFKPSKFVLLNCNIFI